MTEIEIKSIKGISLLKQGKNQEAYNELLDAYLSLKRESFMPRLLSSISPLLASKYVYRKRLGKSLNIKNPKLYNERLMWLKLYYYNKNPLVTECADKYRVRNYVERCGLSKSLNELYGVWDNADDIPWDSLPEPATLLWLYLSSQTLLTR